MVSAPSQSYMKQPPTQTRDPERARNVITHVCPNITSNSPSRLCSTVPSFFETTSSPPSLAIRPMFDTATRGPSSNSPFSEYVFHNALPTFRPAPRRRPTPSSTKQLVTRTSLISTILNGAHVAGPDPYPTVGDCGVFQASLLCELRSSFRHGTFSWLLVLCRVL